MGTHILGTNLFAVAASRLRVDQDEVVAVNSAQRWSSMAARTWLRGVVSPGQRKKKTSSFLPGRSGMADQASY
jgi:hypothetical protein